ncbi:transcriptional regulator, HxlR family [Bacteroides luti]|uniref:Transcriptional regulator, HxlR family n=1 Tax=Bacteroides luti TaxID=1297750 RepID=A0A1M5FAV5_9BACE|nr:helix-turn-helix domain-containing protein [Bacteroides luti]SHF88242.1 transcriptional regulator, HxlR family [Bacteroides luti]
MGNEGCIDKYIFKGKDYFCSLELVMDMIGGKWKPIVLYHLRDGMMRSGELQRSLNGIANKMFTQTVRELEQTGLVERIIYPTVPPKVEYKLTSMGESVIPVIETLNDWGKEISVKYNKNK